MAERPAERAKANSDRAVNEDPRCRKITVPRTAAIPPEAGGIGRFDRAKEEFGCRIAGEKVCSNPLSYPAAKLTESIHTRRSGCSSLTLRGGAPRQPKSDIVTISNQHRPNFSDEAVRRRRR